MAQSQGRRGRLVVVSAPSGTGKSTVCGALVERREEVEVSISYTTRAPRGQERNGVEYHFVDAAAFDAMVEQGAFLEWAKVHDQRYGTARADVDALLDAGKDVLFDIDVQGGQQIKAAVPDALLVYILPPSIEVLVSRLTARGTETPEQIAGRLRTAIWELEQGFDYDCHLVNDNLSEAIADLDQLRSQTLPDACGSRIDEKLRELLNDARRQLVEKA